MRKKKEVTEKNDSLPAKAASLEMTRSYEAIPTYYCNSSTVRYSKNDFHIVLSHLLSRTENALRVCPQAIVYMTPVHAKQLIQLLQSGVSDYEEKFGELQIPPFLKISA